MPPEDAPPADGGVAREKPQVPEKSAGRIGLSTTWIDRVRESCAGARIVIVDDDPSVLQLTAALLVAAGFRATTFEEPEDALAMMRREPPDLLLLDVLLRDHTGVEICRQIRADRALARIPVILVTGAHVSIADQVLGFGVGADDYVLKPWTPELLLSRVAAVLRRVRGSGAERITHGPLVVDPSRRDATLEGEHLALTPTEFHILHKLVASPDRALTRAQLLDESVEPTQPGEEITERNVDVHILSIRRKLGAHRSLIETVFRVGYRIAPA